MFRKHQICDIEGRLEILEADRSTDGTASLQAALKLLEDRVEENHSLLTDQANRLERLTLAMAEGIEKVERKERRIDAVVGRAKKELRDHGFESPSINAEAESIRVADGNGSGESRVPEVPEAVEYHPEVSSIPGVTPAQLRRARGL